MNILFFAEQSPYLGNRVGGAENSMRLIAEGLAARGHGVTFASLRPDALPVPRRFREGRLDVLLCPSPRRSPLQRLLKKAGRGESGPALALNAAGWCRVGRTVFGAARFDLVYAFYELDFLDQALAARDRNPGMAIVMRMAGLGWHDTLGRGRRGQGPARMQAAFNAVDAVNYLSASSRALVEEKAAEIGLGLAPRSSFITDIGVEVGRVPMLWKGPSPGPGLEVVVATRFSAAQKRQDILIEALGLLKDRLTVSATLIGSGPRLEENLRRRDALGLEESVEIVPFMPQEQLWERMRRADLLCHPCDHEGVSKIILEAMMLGLPVLASDVAPLPDYVIEGETGFRAANTPEAWADKLVAIARDRDRLAAISAGARSFVETHYDTGANIARYETEFQALTDGR